MKVSNIGLIEKKLANLDKQFPVQDILMQTGQIMQFGSGIMAFGHVPQLLKHNIDKIVCDVLSSYGCSELSLPILQPENIWKESGRFDRYVKDGVMFRCLSDKGNYCLAPTAEEAIVTFAKARLSSYKQLPVVYFQIGQKFRNEIRTRGYLLRAKSFDMLDAYSFDKSEKDAELSYAKLKEAFIEIFTRLGLKTQAVGADNGAIGGSKSEEFMLLSDIGEDNILFDEKTGKLFNSELLERSDAKDYLLKTYGISNLENLSERKAVELGHIFNLGDKYASTMNANFVDENGSNKNFIMGCYGIGLSRTLAMIYETNAIKNKKGDTVGFSLPIDLAPYVLYIVPKLDDKEKSDKCFETYEKLLKKGINVLIDDRQEVSIGAKIKDSRIVGTPFVCVFGNTLNDNYVEIENNKTGEKTKISTDDFVEQFCKMI